MLYFSCIALVDGRVQSVNWYLQKWSELSKTFYFTTSLLVHPSTELWIRNSPFWMLSLPWIHQVATPYLRYGDNTGLMTTRYMLSALNTESPARCCYSLELCNLKSTYTALLKSSADMKHYWLGLTAIACNVAGLCTHENPPVYYHNIIQTLFCFQDSR